ncbi:kinase-like domain-containing protein [Hypoxylon sp. NC1633]|nr:kinase-like domain-containing protein [Hypoxylon sp. NC1633]
MHNLNQSVDFDRTLKSCIEHLKILCTVAKQSEKEPETSYALSVADDAQTRLNVWSQEFSPRDYRDYFHPQACLDNVKEDIQSAIRGFMGKSAISEEIVRKILSSVENLQRSDNQSASVPENMRASYQTAEKDVRARILASFDSEIETTIPPRLAHLKSLWGNLPDLASMARKINDTPGPVDGMLISDKAMHQSTYVLELLSVAWEAKVERTSPDAEKHLVERTSKILSQLGHICLVLRLMGRQPLIDEFARKGHDNSKMPFELGKLESFLAPDDARRFAGEQYRIARRDWGNGKRIKMYENEPLPFESVEFFGSGGYGAVDKVKDARFKKEYARKKPNTKGSALSQLINEADNLHKLNEYNHVVQLVAIYERGSEHGIILAPAATGNLADLLMKCQNLDYLERNRQFLLKSFACLSYGLYLLHLQHLRHKDVKPENILYTGSGPPLLWADFGLAYAFDPDSNSNTYSKDPPRSRIYAAPELLMWRLGHGRSADIFSLGCVFIRILIVLLGGDAPDHQATPFHKNKKIRDWIHNQRSNQSVSPYLQCVIKLSLEMTEKKKNDRPKIYQVLSRLREASREYFNVCDNPLDHIIRNEASFHSEIETKRSRRKFFRI